VSAVTTSHTSRAPACHNTSGSPIDDMAVEEVLAPEDPVEGSEVSAGRLDRGKHAEHIEVLTHVHRSLTTKEKAMGPIGEPGRTGWGHRQFTRSRPPRAATG